MGKKSKKNPVAAALQTKNRPEKQNPLSVQEDSVVKAIKNLVLDIREANNFVLEESNVAFQDYYDSIDENLRDLTLKVMRSTRGTYREKALNQLKGAEDLFRENIERYFRLLNEEKRDLQAFSFARTVLLDVHIHLKKSLAHGISHPATQRLKVMYAHYKTHLPLFERYHLLVFRGTSKQIDVAQEDRILRSLVNFLCGETQANILCRLPKEERSKAAREIVKIFTEILKTEDHLSAFPPMAYSRLMSVLYSLGVFIEDKAAQDLAVAQIVMHTPKQQAITRSTWEYAIAHLYADLGAFQTQYAALQRCFDLIQSYPHEMQYFVRLEMMFCLMSELILELHKTKEAYGLRSENLITNAKYIKGTLEKCLNLGMEATDLLCDDDPKYVMFGRDDRVKLIDFKPDLIPPHDSKLPYMLQLVAHFYELLGQSSAKENCRYVQMRKINSTYMLRQAALCREVLKKVHEVMADSRLYGSLETMLTFRPIKTLNDKVFSLLECEYRSTAQMREENVSILRSLKTRLGKPDAQATLFSAEEMEQRSLQAELNARELLAQIEEEEAVMAKEREEKRLSRCSTPLKRSATVEADQEQKAIAQDAKAILPPKPYQHLLDEALSHIQAKLYDEASTTYGRILQRPDISHSDRVFLNLDLSDLKRAKAFEWLKQASQAPLTNANYKGMAVLLQGALEDVEFSWRFLDSVAESEKELLREHIVFQREVLEASLLNVYTAMKKRVSVEIKMRDAARERARERMQQHQEGYHPGMWRAPSQEALRRQLLEMECQNVSLVIDNLGRIVKADVDELADRFKTQYFLKASQQKKWTPQDREAFRQRHLEKLTTLVGDKDKQDVWLARMERKAKILSQLETDRANAYAQPPQTLTTLGDWVMPAFGQ